VPVLSGLSERRRGLAHDPGILTAYLLPKFHEKRKPWRTCRIHSQEPRPGPRTGPTGTTRQRSRRHQATASAACGRSPSRPQQTRARRHAPGRARQDERGGTAALRTARRAPHPTRAAPRPSPLARASQRAGDPQRAGL